MIESKYKQLFSIHGQALGPASNRGAKNHVGRSNSAITSQPTKVSSSKLRRHAKSEPISSNKVRLGFISGNFHFFVFSIGGPLDPSKSTRKLSPSLPHLLKFNIVRN